MFLSLHGLRSCISVICDRISMLHPVHRTTRPQSLPFLYSVLTPSLFLFCVSCPEGESRNSFSPCQYARCSLQQGIQNHLPAPLSGQSEQARGYGHPRHPAKSSSVILCQSGCPGRGVKGTFESCGHTTQNLSILDSSLYQAQH